MTDNKDKLVYKVAVDHRSKPVLIELKIPAWAARLEFKVLTPVSNGHYAARVRGRASCAYVRNIWRLERDLLSDNPYVLRIGEELPSAISVYDFETLYVKGEDIRPDVFDPDPISNCSHGINYFLEKDAAIAYAQWDSWFGQRVRFAPLLMNKKGEITHGRSQRKTPNL